MVNNHFINYVKTRDMSQETEVIFSSNKGLKSFCEYDQQTQIKGGEIVFLERNFRSPLEEAELVSFHIEPTEHDYNGVGKYMNQKSFALIKKKDGVEERWPLTMIYFKP